MRVLVQLATDSPVSAKQQRSSPIRIEDVQSINLKDTLIRPLAFAKPAIRFGGARSLRFGGARSATFSRKGKI
jgi:hypothetical protein